MRVVRLHRGLLGGLLFILLSASLSCASTPSPSPAGGSEPRTLLPLATLAPSSSSQPAAGSRAKVIVYSALAEAANRAIVAAFEEAQPVVSLEILSLGAAGELQERIRMEKDAPRADVFLGGSSEYHDPLGKEGLVAAYRSPGAVAVDTSFKDPTGYWTGWYLGVFGVLVNTERWESEMAGKARPATWEDLLDPDLAGSVVMPDPLTTGGGYIFMVDQVFRFNRNEARAMDYMERLDANIAQYTPTAPLTIDLVGRGEHLVGLNWGHDVITAAANGYPVEFVAPDDTAVEVGAVSIIQGGPNNAGARTFVDWVLNKECAKLIVQHSNRVSVLSGVDPAPGAPTLDSVTLVDYDREWAALNRERLVQKWRSVVGR